MSCCLPPGSTVQHWQLRQNPPKRPHGAPDTDGGRSWHGPADREAGEGVKLIGQTATRTPGPLAVTDPSTPTLPGSSSYVFLSLSWQSMGIEIS